MGEPCSPAVQCMLNSTPSSTSSSPTPNQHRQRALRSSFPFEGELKGCGWNCRSLYAYGSIFSIRFAAKLVADHDFLALFETRETQERKATLNQHIPSHCKYFSSFIDQYKGGIGLFVKREFSRTI